MSFFNRPKTPAVIVGYLPGDTPADVATWAQNAADQGMIVGGLDTRDRILLEVFKALAILAREKAPSAPLSQPHKTGE